MARCWIPWRFLLCLWVLTSLLLTTSAHNDEEHKHHPDYWFQLEKAVNLAKCLEHEVLPALDPMSLIMKPASCQKDLAHNERCLKCQGLTRDDKLDFQGFQYELASPKPMFHCTSHIGIGEIPELFRTHFRMEYEDFTNSSLFSIPRDYLPRVFVLEKEVDGKWELATHQIFWFFSLETKSSSTYRVQVTAVSPKYIYPPQMSEAITLYDEYVNYIPTPANFRVEGTTISKTATRPTPKMILRWESASGQNASCDYDVFYMEDEMYTKERKKPEDAFWVMLDKVQFDTTYEINLVEKFGLTRESLPAKIQATVPSCLHLHDFNLDVCPPPYPTNIKVDNESDAYFYVTWDTLSLRNHSFSRRQLQSINYTVEIDTFPNDAEAIFKPPLPVFQETVPGDVNIVQVKNTLQKKGAIRISIVAKSGGGNSEERMIVHHLNAPSSQMMERFWVFSLATFFLLLLLGTAYCAKIYRDRARRNREQKEKWKKLDDDEGPVQQVVRNPSKWEIHSWEIVLHDVIGRGQFGEVRKATLQRKGGRFVAVKTLRVRPDSNGGIYEAEDGVTAQGIIDKFFRDEFEILAGIEPHMHVVGLVGIVREPPSPALVVDYCDGGDLQSHLRKAAPVIRVDRRRCCPSSSPSVVGSSTAQLQFNAKVQVHLSMVTNEAYFINKDVAVCTLTPMDLLSYARQIACGMEFLSSNKVIHRDLAARNILISGKNRILKIADFGLSRDVYEQNWYKKRSNGKVPVKWLAIECLRLELYTTKSDVWSYGVLLWEIVTFGANPYPGIANVKVYDVLKEGYRMSRPDNCSPELYDLMNRCWSEDPNDRPDFTSIRLKIEDLMRDSGEVNYLPMDPSGSVEYSELFSSSNSAVPED